MSERYDNYNQGRRSDERRYTSTSRSSTQRNSSYARVNVGRADTDSRTSRSSQRYESDGASQRYDQSQRYGQSQRYDQSRRYSTSQRSATAQRGTTQRSSAQRSRTSGYGDNSRYSSGSRNSITVGGAPSNGPQLRTVIIAIVAVVVLAIVLFNLVTCIANGAGGASQSSSSAAASQSAASSESSESASSSSATLASTEGVEDPWVEGGRFTTGDAELDQLIKTFCDDLSKPGLSAEDNAFNVYCQGMWREYIERDDNQYPQGPNWDVQYAKQDLTEDGGNCYEQVALGEFILKYFGYQEVYAEPCNVLRQSGEYGEHGILFVTDMDGRKCLCDPAFGANGWMLDADTYTMEIVDIGQDPAEFTIANFERVEKAYWLE